MSVGAGAIVALMLLGLLAAALPSFLCGLIGISWLAPIVEVAVMIGGTIVLFAIYGLRHLHDPLSYKVVGDFFALLFALSLIEASLLVPILLPAYVLGAALHWGLVWIWRRSVVHCPVTRLCMGHGVA